MVNTSKKIIISFLIAIFVFTPFLVPVQPARAASIGGILDSITGDSVPIKPTEDKPTLALTKIKALAVMAITKKANEYLEERLRKIEQDYKISNFLYYSDALVAGQYIPDFLQKYVPPEEQSIVKYMIPQFACSPQATSATIQQQKTLLLKQKARTYLGYDPSTLSPDDPDFYIKMARIGEVYSHPLGWELQMEAVAAQASQAAQQAAQNEINSPGLKTSRSQGETGEIAITVNNLIQAQASDLMTQLQAGITNSQFYADVSSLAQNAIASLGSALGLGSVGQFLSSTAGYIAGNLVDELVVAVYNNLTKNTFIKGAVLIQEKKTCLDDTVQVIVENGSNQVSSISNLIGTNTGTPGTPQDQSLMIVFTAIPYTAAPGQPVTLSWDASMVQGVAYVVKGWDGQTADIVGSEVVTAPATDADYVVRAYSALGAQLGQISAHLFIDTGPRGN